MNGEVHISLPPRRSTKTGEELPPSVEVHSKWDDELEGMLKTDPGRRVCFVERGVKGETVLHVPLVRARDLMEHGHPDLTELAKAAVLGAGESVSEQPRKGKVK